MSGGGSTTRSKQMSMTMQTESSLECPICANRFTVDGPLQPKILKCGHTFCTNCIWQTSKTEINQIKCSFCFGVTPIGALGIYALPVNRTLVDILSHMNLQESLESGTTPVDLCCYCNEKPAEKICFGCDPAGCKLCEQCCNAEHDRPFAPVKSHKPLNINEVTNIPRNFCVKHDQLLTHYSEKAATFACKKCLTELDDGVDVEFLPMEAAIQVLRQRLPKVTEDLENYLRRLQDAQRKMEMIQGQLGVTKSKAMQEIMKKFSKYQIIFQERQKTLLASLETEVNDRRTSLEFQINDLRKITGKVLSYKEHLQALMQKDRQEFLSKYWDTQKEINNLLENEDFSLQRPVAIPDLSVFISDNFESDLHNLGSVGGGPVVDLNAAMHTRGLLQLTWGLPEDSEGVEDYEIEYGTWLPLSVKQADVTRVICDGKALKHFVNAICPGYTYQFRIRCRSVSGWGMWSKSILGKFDEFPCTIGFISKIVTIQIPSTGHYRITAKGAKAADSDRFKGGRGAIISATFLLQKGDLLEILCGGMSERQNCHSGGAGGTFVAVNNRQIFENLLLVAGGGGGTRGYDDQDCDGCDASLEQNGTSATTINCAEGGINGASGKDANFLGPSWGHGGAGWQQSSTTAKSFVEGGSGGECGGFGGGGSVGLYGGGGGGGYSGGGGGRGGGGGGSYVRPDGENISKEIGNLGHGEVEITRISGPPSVAHSKSTSSSNNNSREHMVKSELNPSPCNSFSSTPISQQSSTDQVSETADARTPSYSTAKQLSTNNLSLGSNSENHLPTQVELNTEPLQ